MSYKVTRRNEAYRYEAPGHYDVLTTRLHDPDDVNEGTIVNGLSHFLPGGGANDAVSNEVSVNDNPVMPQVVRMGSQPAVNSVETEDTQVDVEWLARKVAALRVFDDEDGVMNRSILDVGGEALVVSQFTLFASYKKGNRPSWFRAAPHNISVPLYEAFCRELSTLLGRPVGTGEFGANMQVEIVNDGPVTICMDTKNRE